MSLKLTNKLKKEEIMNKNISENMVLTEDKYHFFDYCEETNNQVDCKIQIELINVIWANNQEKFRKL